MYRQASLVTTGQSQNRVGTQTFTGMAAQLGETREWLFLVRPDENYPSIGARTKSTELPGEIPKSSRTAFGMVTCPLAVTVVVMSNSRNTVETNGITSVPLFQPISR